MSDFVISRCLSLPTANVVDLLKQNEAEVIQRSQDYHKNAHQGSCTSPKNGSSFVCANGSAWAISENRHENPFPVGPLPIPLADPSGPPVEDFTATRQAY